MCKYRRHVNLLPDHDVLRSGGPDSGDYDVTERRFCSLLSWIQWIIETNIGRTFLSDQYLPGNQLRIIVRSSLHRCLEQDPVSDGEQLHSWFLLLIKVEADHVACAQPEVVQIVRNLAALQLDETLCESIQLVYLLLSVLPKFQPARLDKSNKEKQN